MAFFRRLKNFLIGIPGCLHQRSANSLIMLNIAQFLGVVNDNLFKFAMAYLLIDNLGQEMASSILSATGAIYVIPFLLFSSSAGILADRFSKQKLLVVMKIVEMVIMLLAFFAFAKANVIACYTLLFLLSAHSALFGPSKYGIIPELVTSEKVSRANGIITAFTYLAVILGTFLSSFLTEITDRRFTLIIVFCFLIAAGGLFTSLRIKPTPAQGSQKKVNFLFIREIFATLKASRKIPHMLPAILGSAFFLFLGGFTQLNIIPYVIKCLHLSEVTGGYLFLLTALGIALGSYLAGKASKKRIELGVSCIAGVLISLFLMLMGTCSASLIQSIFYLVFIGIFGGIFIVPFDTFIQLKSPDDKRGQTIGATNFLSFLGVLIASVLLYVFPHILHVSPSGGFAIVGICTLLFTLLQMFLLSDLFLAYISRVLLYRCYKFSLPDPDKLLKECSHAILILENARWRDALLLMGALPNVHLLICKKNKKCIPWFHRLFYSLHLFSDELDVQGINMRAKALLDEGNIPCLFLEKSFPKEDIPLSKPFLDFFQKKSPRFVFIKIQQHAQTSRLTIHLTQAP